MWIHHDMSVCQMCQAAFLLLAKQPSDGGLDALLLGLFVEGVLAAAYAAQGLRLQRGHDPEDAAHREQLKQMIRLLFNPTVHW